MFMQSCSNEQAQKILELLKVTQKRMRETAIRISKDYGLTLVQLNAIYILCETPNLMLNELSQKMGLSKSTVSSIIDRLEERQIVLREIPRDNRRTVKLSISREFLDTNRNMLGHKKEHLKDILNFNKLSKEEADKVIDGMEKLNKLFVTD